MQPSLNYFIHLLLLLLLLSYIITLSYITPRYQPGLAAAISEPWNAEQAMDWRDIAYRRWRVTADERRPGHAWQDWVGMTQHSGTTELPENLPTVCSHSATMCVKVKHIVRQHTRWGLFWSAIPGPTFGRAVQKWLNGSTSCLGQRLLGNQETLYPMGGLHPHGQATQPLPNYFAHLLSLFIITVYFTF